jgi:hypothetical protein
MEELLLERIGEKWLVKMILDDKEHLENKDIIEFIYENYPLRSKYRYFINKFNKDDFICVIKHYNNTKAYKKNTKNYISYTCNIKELKLKYIQILNAVGIKHELNWYNNNPCFLRLYNDNDEGLGYFRFEYLNHTDGFNNLIRNL